MKTPKLLSLMFSCCALALLMVSPALVAQEDTETAKTADGWITLFDGKSLDGWTRRGGVAEYKVEDGMIIGMTAAPTSPNTFLCSNEEFGDFELEFEVRFLDPKKTFNSGVQIRSKSEGDKRVYGPQVEIEPSPGQAGYIWGESMGTGWIYPPDSSGHNPQAHEGFQNDDWNQYRVVAKGPRLQVWLNGAQVADVTNEEVYKTHPKGFIGLQVHRVGSLDPKSVAWRNIRIRPLGE